MDTRAPLPANLWPGDEEGQGLAEYALILALIAIVVISAFAFFGQQVADLLGYIGSMVDAAST